MRRQTGRPKIQLLATRIRTEDWTDHTSILPSLGSREPGFRIGLSIAPREDDMNMDAPPEPAAERSSPKTDVTQLLQAWSLGDSVALDQLMPMIMSELRRRAAGYLRRERSDHTLQPTALVNELYLRLIDQNRSHWRDRAHFFAVAAGMMRNILVDHARAHRADKRGGGLEKVELDEERDGLSGTLDLIALDDALEALAKLDARQSRIVELRFFGGLTLEETAEVLGVARPTVSRDWRNARAWLMRELGRGPQKPEGS